MARKIEFNRDAKLHKAMKFFWDKGYEATSMNDLVEGLGINRFSIYNSFGDKKGLFLETLALYRKTVLAYLIAPLKSTGLGRELGKESGKERILAYLSRLEEELLKPGGSLGCMIMRSSFSDAVRDQEVKDSLMAMLRDIRDGLLDAVNDAKASGDIQYNETNEALADYLLCHIQGIIMLRRTTGNKLMTAAQMRMLRKEVGSW